MVQLDSRAASLWNTNLSILTVSSQEPVNSPCKLIYQHFYNLFRILNPNLKKIFKLLILFIAVIFFNKSTLHMCTFPFTCDYLNKHYLPIRRIGRGPNLSIRMPSGRVVALSKNEPMVKPKFSISSWSTQLSHSSTSPSEEELPRVTTTESFTVGIIVEGLVRELVADWFGADLLNLVQKIWFPHQHADM